MNVLEVFSLLFWKSFAVTVLNVWRLMSVMWPIWSAHQIWWSVIRALKLEMLVWKRYIGFSFLPINLENLSCPQWRFFQVLSVGYPGVHITHAI